MSLPNFDPAWTPDEQIAAFHRADRDRARKEEYVTTLARGVLRFFTWAAIAAVVVLFLAGIGGGVGFLLGSL